MTDKIYTSAQGRRVDMGALQLKNEDTPAVGNMNVTASGAPLKRERTLGADHTLADRHTPQVRDNSVKRISPDSSILSATERLKQQADQPPAPQPVVAESLPPPAPRRKRSVQPNVDDLFFEAGDNDESI